MTICKGGGSLILRIGGTGICLLLLILLLSSSLPPLRFIPPVSGHRDFTCVQVGHNEEEGPFTIGGKRFRPIDRLPLRHMVLVAKTQSPDYWSEEYYTKYDPFNESASMLYEREGQNCSDGGWNLTANAVDNSNKLDVINYVNWCPDDVIIRIYLVKQNGRVLRGWLHVEVELIPQDDDMEYIYVQLRDLSYNALGEFVSDEKEQCKPSKEELISPTKYQFLPCSTISKREVNVPQAIFMAKNSQYADRATAEPYSSKIELSRGIHFTWRLNEYWCNHHKHIRIDALVWTKKSHDIFRRLNTGNNGEDKFCDKNNFKNCQLRRITTHWIEPNFFGAADIKIEGDLDCSTPATDRSGNLTPAARSSWLPVSIESQFLSDYVHPSHRKFHENGDTLPYYESCQVDPNPQGKKTDWKNIVTFGGRCNSHNNKTHSRDYRQECSKKRKINGVVNAETFFKKYSEYLPWLTQQRLLPCSVDCQVPDINSTKDLEEIQSYERGVSHIWNTSRPLRINWETLSAKRREVRAVLFWTTRKFHGNLCIFFSMFLLPVSNFLSRYYKETFMRNVSLGCAPWFWFHMLVCFAVPTLYHCSYSAMGQNIQNFGRSTSPHAVLHRAVGYVFIGMFILMICLGGLRCVAVGARMVCMTLHSISGFVLYIVSIKLIITSAYIPASPSLSKCAPETEGLPIGISFSGWVAVVWLVIDLVFHLMLTALQLTVDKYYKIERAGLGIAFVPVLAPPTNVARDLDASILRKRVLIVYVIISLVFTFTAIGELYAKEDPGNCTLGNLTCDLTQVLPNMSSSPFGCSSSALKYYARIMQKYAENSSRTDL